MFKRTGKWLVAASIGLFFSASANAAVVVLSDTLTLVGPNLQAKNYTFNINSIGTYQASLTDLHLLAPFQFISLAISATGGNSGILGSIFQPGSFNFSADHTGSYTASVIGAPGPFSIATPGGTFSGYASTYGISVTAVPEPEVWAMMLIGVGLIGYQLRRKSKAGPVKIVA